jgi:competence ComEA-like helix-hairpin-helix protein
MNNGSHEGWWPLIPNRSEQRGFLVLAVIVFACLAVSWIDHHTTGPSQQTVQAPEESYPRLNTASAGRIEEIPGIGLERAERIVRYRRREGRISTMEELNEVPGIGSDTIRTLRTYARLQPVEGIKN